MRTVVVLAMSLNACQDAHLTTEPPTILTDEQVWDSPDVILGVLSNFYSRMPNFFGFDGASQGDVPTPFVHFDEALFSGNTFSGDAQANQIAQYAFNTAAAWTGHYNLIRDIHVAIDGIEESNSPLLPPAVKTQLQSELRFQRAWVYFDLVKRMGGVPIVTSQQIYDFGGDPTYLQQPRNTEAEVYEFIASELDQIAGTLGNEGSYTRANRYAALALKSRAMLYAGSLARHNSEMGGPITLTGGEVGIPGARAAEFYQRSLEASRELINNGPYSLYEGNANPGENFYEALASKSGNPEVIWAKDFSASGGVSHIWTLSIIPPSQRMDALGGNQGSTISPSLQLVETFDYLDGSPGTLPGVGDGTVAGQANWIFYDEPDDIFAGKDGRLWGTIIYPGSTARGGNVEIQAGVYVWNSSTNRYDKVHGSQGSTHADGGLLTGVDGPIPVQSHVGTTGFYLRKYLDPNPAAATAATLSDMWWVRFRLGEIYLNAAEAAYELGETGEALEYMNRLRQRAGFAPNSLATLDRAKIRSERWAELAFEGHRLWDVKRWRIAHEIWDGSSSSTTANLYSLWPYRIVRPGHPNDGKYVFDKFPSQRQTTPRFWRFGNYYSEIPSGVRSNNPQLVPNPFH